MTARVVVSVVPDLFFAARIAATAAAVGVTVESALPAHAAERARSLGAGLVLFDLHAEGVLEAARAIASDPALAHCETVGFYSHVDQATRAAAVAAGVRRVMPRSAFTTLLPRILAGEPTPAHHDDDSAPR